MVNEFGTMLVDVLRPDLLLVPSAKSLTAPPPALARPAVDHFKCYKVRGGRIRLPGVEVTDKFGTLTVNVKKPIRLCVAADSGNGILDPSAHLLCYQVRTASQSPRFEGPGPIFVDNQFGPDTFAVTRPTELCVPSASNP